MFWFVFLEGKAQRLLWRWTILNWMHCPCYMGLFRNTGVRRVLNGKNFETVDSVFSLVAGLVDQAIGQIQFAPIPRVPTMYTELLNRMTKNWNEGERIVRAYH